MPMRSLLRRNRPCTVHVPFACFDEQWRVLLPSPTVRPSVSLMQSIEAGAYPPRLPLSSYSQMAARLGHGVMHGRQIGSSLAVAIVYPAISTIVLITPRLGASAAIIIMIAFDFPPREIIWPKACCDGCHRAEGSRLVRTGVVNFSDGSCFSAKLVRVPPPTKKKKNIADFVPEWTSAQSSKEPATESFRQTAILTFFGFLGLACFWWALPWAKP